MHLHNPSSCPPSPTSVVHSVLLLSPSRSSFGFFSKPYLNDGSAAGTKHKDNVCKLGQFTYTLDYSDMHVYSTIRIRTIIIKKTTLCYNYTIKLSAGRCL